MTSSRLALGLVAVVAVGALGAGVAGAFEGDRPSALASHPTPAAAVQTTFPGLAPATGEPDLPGLAQARPARGTVTQLAGPFDDRFDFQQLMISPALVSGALTISSDVSDVLELQVLAGFYDTSGRLVGTGRWTHHLDEELEQQHTGPPDEHSRFRIRIPDSLRGQVVAAAVGVPVLVNE